MSTSVEMTTRQQARERIEQQHICNKREIPFAMMIIAIVKEQLQRVARTQHERELMRSKRES
jgi:hypothetical protein